MEKTNDFIRLNGIAMYARLRDPQRGSNGFADAWTLDLLLDGPSKVAAQKAGLKIRMHNKDGKVKYEDFIAENGLVEKGYTGEFISANKEATKKAFGADGKPLVKMENGMPVFDGTEIVYEKISATPPNVYDASRNQIPADKVPSIGNGTEVSVTVTAKNGNSAIVEGEWGARLVSVTILNLVEYVAASGPMGSYVYEASASDDIPAFARA